MEDKRFKMIDEAFVCQVCGMEVLPLGYTARDHCPNCLCSLHLDINPGDRASDCGGVLRPIVIEKGKKDSIKIVYKCTCCGEIKRNKAALDDNYDIILDIMSNPIDISSRKMGR